MTELKFYNKKGHECKIIFCCYMFASARVRKRHTNNSKTKTKKNDEIEKSFRLKKQFKRKTVLSMRMTQS